MTVPVVIQGLGTIYTQAEYTSPSVQTQYNAHLNVLKTIANSSLPPTLTDATNYNNAIAGLLSLAQNSSPPITYAMGNSIEGLVVMSHGVNTSGIFNTGSTVDIQNWKNLMLQGFGGVLQTAEAAGGRMSQTSLQSYIQLDYINSGNRLINVQLSQLQEALETNQAAIDLLAALQQFKNGVLTGAQGTAILDNNGRIVSFLKIETRNYADASAWDAGLGIGVTRNTAVSLPKDYSNSTSSEFSHRLMIQVKGSASIVNTVEAQGAALVTKIQDLITKIEAVSPTPSPPKGTSLQEQLQKVLTHMTQGGANGNTTDRTIQWILDNYNDQQVALPDGTNLAAANFNVAKSGSYQLALSNAVSTAQATNSALNVQLGNTFLVFTEFYNSASSVLKTVHDIIIQMSKNAARR